MYWTTNGESLGFCNSDSSTLALFSLYPAAIAAGYSEKRARVEASELQNPRLSPLVVQYIGSLREEKLKKFEVTYDRHVAELGKIREAALKKGAFSAATNAEKNRGMAAGLYIDRKIIKTGKLEDLSEEELRQEKQPSLLAIARKELVWKHRNYRIQDYHHW